MQKFFQAMYCHKNNRGKFILFCPKALWEFIEQPVRSQECVSTNTSTESTPKLPHTFELSTNGDSTQDVELSKGQQEGEKLITDEKEKKKDLKLMDDDEAKQKKPLIKDGQKGTKTDGGKDQAHLKELKSKTKDINPSNDAEGKSKEEPLINFDAKPTSPESAKRMDQLNNNNKSDILLDLNKSVDDFNDSPLLLLQTSMSSESDDDCYQKLGTKQDAQNEETADEYENIVIANREISLIDLSDMMPGGGSKPLEDGNGTGQNFRELSRLSFMTDDLINESYDNDDFEEIVKVNAQPGDTIKPQEVKFSLADNETCRSASPKCEQVPNVKTELKNRAPNEKALKPDADTPNPDTKVNDQKFSNSMVTSPTSQDAASPELNSAKPLVSSPYKPYKFAPTPFKAGAIRQWRSMGNINQNISLSQIKPVQAPVTNGIQENKKKPEEETESKSLMKSCKSMLDLTEETEKKPDSEDKENKDFAAIKPLLKPTKFSDFLSRNRTNNQPLIQNPLKRNGFLNSFDKSKDDTKGATDKPVSANKEKALDVTHKENDETKPNGFIPKNEPLGEKDKDTETTNEKDSGAESDKKTVISKKYIPRRQTSDCKILEKDEKVSNPKKESPMKCVLDKEEKENSDQKKLETLIKHTNDKEEPEKPDQKQNSPLVTDKTSSPSMFYSNPIEKKLPYPRPIDKSTKFNRSDSKGETESPHNRYRYGKNRESRSSPGMQTGSDAVKKPSARKEIVPSYNFMMSGDDDLDKEVRDILRPRSKPRSQDSWVQKVSKTFFVCFLLSRTNFS